MFFYFWAGEVFGKTGGQNLARFTWVSSDFTPKSDVQKAELLFRILQFGWYIRKIIMQPKRLYFCFEWVYPWPTFKPHIIHILVFFFPASTSSPSSLWGCLRSRLDNAIFGNAYLGQKRLGPRQFGGSKIAFAEVQGVATQRLRFVGWMFSVDLFGHWNWGHGEVLWYVCLRKSNSDLFLVFSRKFLRILLGSTEFRGSCRSQLGYQQPLSKCILHAYNGFVPRFWPLIRPTNSCIVIYMLWPPREQRFSWTGAKFGEHGLRPISRWWKDSEIRMLGGSITESLYSLKWMYDHFSTPTFWIFFSAPPSNLRRQDCILGSMAFVALFFSVDGSAVAARSPEECPVQQGTIWWYTFVALCPGDGNFKRIRQIRDAVILGQLPYICHQHYFGHRPDH